jgi:hypothetical protein
VIISTGKQSLEAADSYTRYILETMISLPLFRYLSLNPSKFYQMLIFKDPYNYIAFNEEGKIDSRLQLMGLLPLKLQHIFKGVLYELLIKTGNERTNTLPGMAL